MEPFRTPLETTKLSWSDDHDEVVPAVRLLYAYDCKAPKAGESAPWLASFGDPSFLLERETGFFWHFIFVPISLRSRGHNGGTNSSVGIGRI
ncbi:MAG: hypothetical protein AAF191_20205 [Verrucomicrobiota bacterium]